MNFLIHIPNFAMKASILVTWGAGCSCVAGNIYSRFFMKTPISSMTVQFWTRLWVVMLGIIFFPQINFLNTSLSLLGPSIIVGYLGGILVVEFEMWNVRKYHDHLNANTKRKKKIQILEKDIGEKESFELGLCDKPQKVSDWKNRSIFYIYEIKNKEERYSLFMLVGIAVLEEIIFRGYLLSFCFLLPKYLAYSMMILLIIIFGIKHVHARSREFVAKSFLGIITTAETLFFGNVIAAAITHGYLNYYVYNQRKNMDLKYEISN